jgi:hypothetical protein
MLSERGKDRRRSRSFRGHLQRLARANRLQQLGMGTLALALISGITFARCNSSSLTGPETSAKSSGIKGDLVSGGEVLESVPNLPSAKIEDDPDLVKTNPDFSTSTRTTFFVTEVAHNPCVVPNEDPVLTGYETVYEKLAMDDLTLKYKLQRWRDTRGVAATAKAAYDDDRNPATPPRMITVRYRNRNRALDRFEVGPAGLPFTSEQEEVIYLERLSPEHGMKYGPYDDREDDDDDRGYQHGPGDDLFVFARDFVRIDKNGVAKQQTTFRSECK